MARKKQTTEAQAETPDPLAAARKAASEITGVHEARIETDHMNASYIVLVGEDIDAPSAIYNVPVVVEAPGDDSAA